MFANSAKRVVAQNQVMGMTHMRYFGVLPKLPKLELTMRTPYKTFFKDFNSFVRLYVGTSKGQMSIGNKTIPRVYLLPPGQIRIAHMQKGEGMFTNSESGEFIHTGGWLFVHDNNSVEVNLLECVEREEFLWDNLDSCRKTETESTAGAVAATLQDKTVKLLQRRR